MEAADVPFFHTAEAAKAMCSALLLRAEHEDFSIAVDVEGWDLGPDGKVAVVTVAVSPTEVYLFDFGASRDDARKIVNEGLLKDVLEHPRIEKIMYDCRSDTGALFHQYQVRLENVLDLQVPALMQLVDSVPGKRSPYLIGMGKAFAALNLTTPADEETKRAGKLVFAPEKGGAYEAWFARPMDPALVQYCVSDVKHFFDAKDILAADAGPTHPAKVVAKNRVRRCVESRAKQANAKRDF
ncbi:hypothetical protein DIPPA_27067 [Diplonema papillatum]|nr:hypothetical protein DIPPA_27067 [Diplonema papillatum]